MLLYINLRGVINLQSPESSALVDSPTSTFPPSCPHHTPASVHAAANFSHRSIDRQHYRRFFSGDRLVFARRELFASGTVTNHNLLSYEPLTLSPFDYSTQELFPGLVLDARAGPVLPSDGHDGQDGPYTASSSSTASSSLPPPPPPRLSLHSGEEALEQASDGELQMVLTLRHVSKARHHDNY